MARLENLTDRGLETQEALRNALLDLILEKGYEAVTVRDITDRVGVERTTFYLHFKGKDDVLVQAQKLMIDELKGSSFGADVIVTLFRRLHAKRSVYRALLQVDALARAEAGILEYSISALLASGVLADLAPRGLSQPQLAAYFVAATLRNLCIWWLGQDDPSPPETMAATAADLVTKGLGALISH